MLTEVLQADFYREFLMKRGNFEPSDFGVELSKSEFIDRIAEAFNVFTHAQLSVDELLLRPTAAIDFCNTIKRSNGWYDVPDDIILRSLLQRRKNPAD